jgi:hypothetical protein
MTHYRHEGRSNTTKDVAFPTYQGQNEHHNSSSPRSAKACHPLLLPACYNKTNININNVNILQAYFKP